MYHFIGILDPDASSLAQFISTLGYKVDGSDKLDNNSVVNSLSERDIKVNDESRNNVHENMIIVKNDCIEEDNIELAKARELGLKIYNCSQMRNRFTEMFQSIIVSGCTGVNITNELMTYVLAEILGCNYMLSDGRGFANKENKFLCIEATSDKNKWLEMNPYYAIITDIDVSNEQENLDIVVKKYEDFARKSERFALVNGDAQYTHLLDNEIPKFYFGVNDDNDIVAKEIEYKNTGTSFEVHVEDNYYGNFELPIYGKQMLLNVLSVIGICYYERIEVKYLNKALKSFFADKNIFNEKQFKDIVTVNSVIRHPKDIKNIIKSLKQKYPDNKLVSIFDINDVPNNEYLNDMFTDSINLSNKVYGVGNNNSAKLISNIDNYEYLDLSDTENLAKLRNTTLLFLNSGAVKDVQKEFEETIQNKNRK